MKLFNTLSRQIEEFKPINPPLVKMYTCGITVYSHPHIGNWFAYIYSDILNRVLIADGFTVERTQNITDVGHLISDDDDGEDKMEKGARAEGLTAWDVADKYIRICDSEAKSLDLLSPTHLVRATDLINEQIKMIQELERKGFTYVIKDGVYFNTAKLDDYGKLARLDIKGLKAGARVEIRSKKYPTDFALWKFSPKDQKRDMEWESPWGIGFPGWHLECSVIARETLGDQIDIHTGGIDHIPVHHTNEIAQTEAATGKIPMSRYWFHNNHIKIDGGKMSKSLGNIYTLEDIQSRGYSLQAFRLMVLSSHYRTEGNFTWEIMQSAQNRLNGWLASADNRWQFSDSSDANATLNFEELTIKFEAHLDNDLNTPQALTVIDQAMTKIFDKQISENDSKQITAFLKLIKSYLGLNLSHPDISEEQRKVLHNRQEARKNQDWASSDRLRKELWSMNIAIKDTENGQKWHWNNNGRTLIN
jgi:cysteinyl-tRNA synthetase